jgi:energy-coupling factor transporter ATP-binding protein EcfA2
VSIVGKVRETLRREHAVDADALLDRIGALKRFLRAADGRLPESELVAARTIAERAGARLELSRDYTVVALAGSTGSGKSSLFNALAKLTLSPVGVRRPTTGMAHACVWGPLEPASQLLDWIGVLPRHRFIRESALDADDEASLRGLILLDLPDFDSIERAHRLEVDRVLGLVDLVIWVLDPQKYADRVLHASYLRSFRRHGDVTVVVLNQADRLSPTETEIVIEDLRRLLAEDGLHRAPTMPTSARQPEMLGDLRELLELTVAERQAALQRLAADVAAAADELVGLVGPSAAEDVVDRTTVRQLTDSLAVSAGVPAVVEATGQAYRHRAAGRTGWPVMRGLRRLRSDPLRRLHLERPPASPYDAAPPTLAATSVPKPDVAQRSAVGLNVRAVATRAAEPLPHAWAPALIAAARSHLDALPDALDHAVAGTDLGVDRVPLWWRAVGGLQWLFTILTLVGLGWLLGGYGVRVIGLPELEYPMVGNVPLPTVMFVGGLVLGALLALLVRPLVRLGARRARRRAEARLRTAITEVAREHVVAPVREVLHGYAEAREALTAARAE